MLASAKKHARARHSMISFLFRANAERHSQLSLNFTFDIDFIQRTLAKRKIQLEQKKMFYCLKANKQM